MHLGVLAQAGSWYYQDLERAAASRGHRCTRLDFTTLTAQVGSRHEAVQPASGRLGLDCLLVRSMPPGSLEQVVFRMNALARWAALGLSVVNSPRALECAIDKYLTTARLAGVGLPVPETVVCESAEEGMLAFERLEGDVVVKPIFGSEGRGIVRLSDPDLAWRTLTTLSRLSAVLYIQQFIPHPGYDTRVLVLDGRVLGGIRRHSLNDFRTNVSREAIAEAYDPTDEECQLAIKATEVTGARFAGVDLLEDDEGDMFVIEVNAVPGWRAFADVNQLDVADRFIAAIEADQRATIRTATGS